MKKLLLLLFFAGLTMAQTPKPPSGLMISTSPLRLSVAGLHVVGNQILNSSGQQVALHGVDINGTDFECGAGTFGDTPSVVYGSGAVLINGLLNWNINVVRITINEDCWLGINGLPASPLTAAQYQTDLINYINDFTAAGIAVIFDLQFASSGSVVAYNNFPTPSTNSLAFWNSVSAKPGIASNNSVMFDLLNEPRPDNYTSSEANAWSCLLNGGPGTSGVCNGIVDENNTPYTTVGTQALVSAIRTAGASNIILVPCIAYGNVCDQWLSYLPTDPNNNLVNTVHLYPGQECQGFTCWNGEILPIIGTYPVIIGETGDAANVYTAPLLSWFDAHAAGSHYLAWAWNSANAGLAQTSDCANNTAPCTGIPTSSGLGFRNHILYTSGGAIPTLAPIPYFCTGSCTYPFGIWAGGTSNYTSSSLGATFYGDINNASNPGLVGEFTNPFTFTAFTTADTITGNPDPTLYQTGRQGTTGAWIINVPNGNYNVTLGVAPNSSYNTGQCGQDQYLQNNIVANAVWNPTTVCGTPSGPAPPATDTVGTITYPVSVFSQQISIQVAASFGGGRTTMLNSILITQGAALTIPNAPTGLSATPGNNQVTLHWTDGGGGASSYSILRSALSGGFFFPIDVTTSTSYTDTAVLNGITYYYATNGSNGAGTGPLSASVGATPNGAMTGVWYNVTPTNMDVVDSANCTNANVSYGLQTIQSDLGNPGVLYAQNNCQGVWKSTDYGQTWLGPLNTGTNGQGAAGAGGITVASPGSGQTPIIYAGMLRSQAGVSVGVYTSTNGAVDWTYWNTANVPTPPGGTGRYDVYPPIVDPYNYQHLLMCGHEQDWILETIDGGAHWSSISLNSGMLESAGTGFVFFIDTGAAGTPGTHSSGGTANTWIWLAQSSGGTYGTWRTANGGTLWTQVSTNEHPHGASQIAQQGYKGGIDGLSNNGVMYLPGVYGTTWGLLRSTDYGVSWTGVGANEEEDNVVMTSKNIYVMDGGAIGLGNSQAAHYQTAAQPGTGTWAQPSLPAGIYQMNAQFATVNDGTHNIVVGAMWGAGIWRYIEP